MPVIFRSIRGFALFLAARSLRGAAFAFALAGLASAAEADPLTILNPAVRQKAAAAKPAPAVQKPAVQKPAVQKAKTTPWPTFAQVEKAVEKHFSTFKKYRKGDLLSQSDVAPVFDALEKLGWKVADREEILKRAPGDRELMVRILRSDPDRAFMRDSQKYPGGYDRIDHLSRLSDAETLLGRLTAGPDGYKMIDYMTTTPWGKTMGEMLSQDPNGQGFNQSTGRIYTEQQLIARLKQSYAKAEKSRAKTKTTSGASSAKPRKP